MSLPEVQTDATAADPMPLHGIDHVELWVGNAQQAAYYFEHAFGFRPVAYAGLETGAREHASHVLRQGRVRLVVTGALGSSSPIAAHHRRHGDGIRTLALGVPDVDAAFRHAMAAGATPAFAPRTARDEHGAVRTAGIETFGDTLHVFVDRSGYRGPFLPGYVATGGTDASLPEDRLLALDHVVGNVELGAMEEWVHFYERVLGMTEMTHFTDRAISTEYSALMSKVLTTGDGRIKLPINEPAAGRGKSQIDEYLEFYEGPGAQHLALATRDIVGTVRALRAAGVGFLPVPDAYYDAVLERVPAVAGRLADLRAEGILVDHDDEGHLLQVFTRPLGDRPTVFLELIERHGARGFGEGNFQALFAALEREQARRGNL